MGQFQTGTRGVVCNVGGGGADADAADEKTNPVLVAKKNTEAAIAAEEEINAEQQRADDTAAANDARDTAMAATTAANKSKPNGAAGRKLHHVASIAHADAKSAYSTVAGSGSGNDLDTRAKATRRADEHGALAKSHAAIAGGVGGFSRNSVMTGSRGVVCNVMTDNGGPGSGPQPGGGSGTAGDDELWIKQHPQSLRTTQTTRGAVRKSLENHYGGFVGKPPADVKGMMDSATQANPAKGVEGGSRHHYFPQKGTAWDTK